MDFSLKIAQNNGLLADVKTYTILSIISRNVQYVKSIFTLNA